MAAVLPVMLLVGVIAGVVSFGLVQSLARLFPRGRESAIEPIDMRPRRMRTATLE